MEVPIKFDYKGKEYTGNFSSVSGAGNTEYNHWHLMINGYYNGQFICTQLGWKFYSQTGEFQELRDFFEFYMVSWFS